MRGLTVTIQGARFCFQTDTEIPAVILIREFVVEYDRRLFLRLLAGAVLLSAVLCAALCREFSRAEIDAATERARENLRAKRHADLHRIRSRREAGAAQHAEVARLFEETTRELLRSAPAEGSRQDTNDIGAVSLDGTTLSNQCPQPNIVCSPTKPFREADGSCNNLQNPGWGRAGSCMNRLLPPAYSDGISKPRVAANGAALPNARYISYTVHPDANNPATNITHMVMQLGQFIDHDFALAPLEPDPQEIVNLGNPNNPIDCCSPSRRNMSECFSITIPSGDPFFAAFGQTCMNMPRSAPCTRCNLGKPHDAFTFCLVRPSQGVQFLGSCFSDKISPVQAQGEQLGKGRARADRIEVFILHRKGHDAGGLQKKRRKISLTES
ncbi:hypothetical protein HPB48_005900 [Haemaphysalis longicornis]|uniref:Peroxidase n=1 Tax=Haemaphysalis longicornis TaxID=44386 RepID=A0A9J6FL79_HAELO|nr:hypothetical protein HPB48_005900 [Haemaphysalis longicornis]